MQPAGGVKNGTVKGSPEFVRQTSATPNCTPEMNGDVVPPLLTTEGRAWDAPRSSRVSSPVITLKGRPDETSISGAKVKPPMKCRQALSPLFGAPVIKTALVTQRCRWSLTEFAFSRFAKRLSCGSRVDCKSVPLSIECEYV